MKILMEREFERDCLQWTISIKKGSQYIVDSHFRGTVPTFKYFVDYSTAAEYANQKIREKIDSNYREINNPDRDNGIPELNYFTEKNIDLPTNWKEVRKHLLPGELAVYEKHNDSRTKTRRLAIAGKYKILLESTTETSEVIRTRKAAWLFLRYSYLGYLTSMALYNPAIQEGAIATVGVLKKKLEALPKEKKAIIDAELRVLDRRRKPTSLKEREEVITNLIDRLAKNIREKDRVGFGGVSKKRAQLIMREQKGE